MRIFFFIFILCFVLSPPARASVSSEELKEAQKKILERELQNQEAIEDLLAQAQEAMRKSEWSALVDKTSELLVEYKLEKPKRAEVYVMRAIGRIQRGEYDKAKTDCDEALRNNKEEARAYLVRSNVFEKTKQTDQAISDMEAYLRLKPNEQVAISRLQQLRTGTTGDTSAQKTPAKQTDPNRKVPETTKELAKESGALDKGGTAPATTTKPVVPSLQFAASNDKSFGLYKPADWKFFDAPGPESRRITVVAPDQSAVVDFLWLKNTRGQKKALLALDAYEKCLVPGEAKVEWYDVYKSADETKARVSMRYTNPNLSLEGTFYLEATGKSLSVQGYMTHAGLLQEKRPLLFNIMSSLAFSKNQVERPVNPGLSVPQYYSPSFVNHTASDNSLAMSTPQDWGFLAQRGTVLTSAGDGGQGFAFLSFEGNPIVKGASVLQGVIATKYMQPAQTLKTILAGFGHKNIVVKTSQPDPATNQTFLQQIRRQCDTQDIMASWTSSQGAQCLGFFKIINAAPSATGLWFSILAGIWGPEKDFYLYYPMLEKVAGSFAINDAFAKQYIQAGLKRAKEMHDKTMAMMRDNANQREQQQKDWEARQKSKDMMESKWDDYRRGKTYWVSDMENGKIYEGDTYGLKDKDTGNYYEGGAFKYTQFDGQNPRHPSETMQQVTQPELEKLMNK
jgi:tetratricopeptide (TPR) repeat protein